MFLIKIIAKINDKNYQKNIKKRSVALLNI